MHPGPDGEIARPQQSQFWPAASCARTPEGMYLVSDTSLPPRDHTGGLSAEHYEYLDHSCTKPVVIEVVLTYVQDDWWVKLPCADVG